jgi:hypothetical protein
MKKYILFTLFQYKTISCIKHINEIAINMQTNDITWKIVILPKKTKNNEFGVTMTEKH